MPATNDRTDDFERGVKNRRAVLGDAWVDQSLANANAFNADFQDLISRYAWHDIWGRPGLDHPTRRLLVLGMTMGMARWEEFELHCRAAVRASQQPGSGVTLSMIRETLMQGAIYCGVPAANTAFKLATGILRDEGLAPDPAPLVADTRVAVHHTFSQPQLKVALQGAADGRGVPVVLSHALGLDLHMWDGLAETLAARGHPVLRYDHRGHGGSAVVPGACAMDDLVDDAARLLGEWGRGPVLWIGLSMGGMVGQGLAIRHPEAVQALVLANTAARYPAASSTVFRDRVVAVERGGMAAIAESVIERYFSAAFRASAPDTVQRFREVVLRCDPVGYAGCCAAVGNVDWLDCLDRIRCPTLVVAGGQDQGTPVALSQAIAERIAGSQLVVIEEAAHLSTIEEPSRFGQVLDRFLQSTV